ncbi:MAG: hypothetical protein LCH67_09365 [Bacteroidetes bacterium]|nr:hypothetical protein [Bacteroidota bacterium]
MKNKFTLFTVLGWEERFLLGTNYIIEKYKIKIVYLIRFIDYLHMDNMAENYESFKKILSDSGIELIHLDLEYRNSINNWKILDSFFLNNDFQNVTLNITTFPREAIWTMLFYLRKKKSLINYVYFKPTSYDNSEGGLTKNHKSPRLLFKHSGIFDINKKLALFIITGFDQGRTDLFIEYYEPSKVVYFSQKGEQFENMKRNSGISPKIAFENIEIENFEIDSYDVTKLSDILNDLVYKHKDYNVIISCQGPKISAISTYITYLKNNTIALAYVPAREFSGKYSFGCNMEAVFGQLKF